MKVLNERGSRYGKFSDNARVSQQLKSLVVNTDDPVIAEGLTAICQKLSRIATGDPNYIDNYRDIAGYAQLIVSYLEEEAETATDAVVQYVEKAPSGSFFPTDE